MVEYSSDQVLRNIYGSSATQETLSMLGGNISETNDIPYKPPASGRIDYSPFNVEDVVFLMSPIKYSIKKISNQVFRNRAARLWRPGSFKSSQKWANQFVNRGWTNEQVTETIKTGKNFQQINRIHPKNGATRFQNKETGKSVVIDNKTYELLQVGGEGFKW